MTTVSTGFRPARLRTKKEHCAYCNDPLPAKRRRSREYCSKSCCNRASEERGKVNGRTRPDGLPPFWPLGLEKDFALLGAVRGSVRSVCDELWGLLRRVDAEELEFRRSVEMLRGRLLSQLDPQDLLVSVERFLGDVNKEHAQKLSQLQNEKESVERRSAASSERCRLLENELTQVRAESTKREERWRKREDELRTKEEEGRKREDEFRRREEDFRKKEEDFRKKEEELKQRLTAVSVERDAQTKKCELLQIEHVNLQSAHQKLVESVATLQRRKPEKDEVIDVTEQLSVVGRRVKTIHDWVESKSGQQDPQTQFQVARLEQFAESVAQKLSQRLVIRFDTSAQTTQLQRLEQGMDAVSQQVAWLIKNPPQPVAPTINWKPVQSALQLVYDQVRGMRAETNLSPIYSALNELSARMGRQQTDFAPILQQLQRVESQIARLPMPVSTPTPRARDSESTVAQLKKEKAALKRRLDKLEPLAQENEELQEQLGEAEQVIEFLKARQPVPGIELDDAGALMLDYLDLKNEIAEYQQALGVPVTGLFLADKSPIGRATAVAKALRFARSHLVRSPAPMFGEPARWDSDGLTLNRAGEDRLEERLTKEVKQLRKQYDQLYREYHED